MNTKEIIVKATDGLVGSAVNGVLWWLYLYGASFGKRKGSSAIYQMFREADEALADFNYESFKQILSRLQKEQFIKKKEMYSGTEIAITRAGYQRITKMFPEYRVKRPWDGYLYLISYDIPENKRVLRDLLRRYLKQIGCAVLQESLWLTPYNPRKLVDEFVSLHAIEGTLLVSRLGKDGAVGDEGLNNLLERVYQLQKLNYKYVEFIDLYQKANTSNVWTVARAFRRIITEDPQLPFALLPKGWRGDEAYRLYQKICKNRHAAAY